MSVLQAKVPVAIATGLISLLVGGGLGAAIMSYSANKPDPQAGAAPAAEDGKTPVGDPKGGAPPIPGGGKGPGGGGKGPGGGKGGAKAPGPKEQLTQLVGKLDSLTRESLHIELTADQKKQAKELLADLSEKDAITDDEAKAKLEALLKLLEPNRKALEAAGYAWPGAPPPAASPPPNPFKAGDGADRLKSLQGTLGK